MDRLIFPSVNADPTEHADWIELEALRSLDGCSSFETFVSQVRISGGVDALSGNELAYQDADEQDRFDRGGELSKSIATNAWTEIERREAACAGGYPFTLYGGHIQLKEGWNTNPYVFQLLLTQYGHRVGPVGVFAERIFEHLSCVAAQSYFGGLACSVRKFGFPREERTGFAAALVQLCDDLNEGVVNANARRIAAQKDSHLDVVVWRPFSDGQTSKVIGFGQCATGDDWHGSKAAELQPDAFMKKWLSEHFFHPPIRMLFVPRCIPHDRWREIAYDAGIIFDRCRISEHFGSGLDSSDTEMCDEWTSYVARDAFGRVE